LGWGGGMGCGGCRVGVGGVKRRIYRMFAIGSNCVVYAELGVAREFGRRQTGKGH
jgi:hypothetical protein